MADEVDRTLEIAKLQERLRQERETFDQKKQQDHRWFFVRMAMGWIAVVLLPSIATISGVVLLNHEDFPASVLLAASGALFVDALGLVVAVWKLILGSGPAELAPLTPDI